MFSIIIPNYNRAEVIPKAIRSVLNQTYTNFELIVVDDCSTDNSFQLISKIADERLKVYRLKKNSGAAAARNYGIEKAIGDYISLLDSDDYYDPDFLKESFNVISKSPKTVGFIWTGVRYIEKGIYKDFIWKPAIKETPYLTFLNSLHIGTNSGITFKKEIFKVCGNFRENLPAAEDTEFFLRVTKHYNFSFVNKVLINIERDSSDRLSKNFKKIAQAYNYFLSDHFSYIDKEKQLQKKYYYKMMWLNYHLADQKVARYYFNKIPKELRSFKIKIIRNLYESVPLKLASYIHQKLSS